MNVWLRVSYNTLASLCVGGKEAIHLLNGIAIINPRRACAARVTVVGLCACVCVCLSVCLLLNISL